jgi:hypothetical protein
MPGILTFGYDGHVVSTPVKGGALPTAAAGLAAGSAPPAPALSPNSTDFTGVLWFGSGTTPTAAGDPIVTLTFARAYGSTQPPVVLATNALGGLAISPGVANAPVNWATRIEGTNGHWTGFSVVILPAIPVTAGQGSGTANGGNFVLNYLVIDLEAS